MIGLNDSGGARIQEGRVRSLGGYADIFIETYKLQELFHKFLQLWDPARWSLYSLQ
jgi:hypothetical protein